MDKYNTYKNKLINVIRYAERQYYQDKFKLAKGNMNKTWQILKTVINPNAQNKPTIDKIVIDDLFTTDKPGIANKFNEYFVNVGPTLANNILPVPGDVTRYIKSFYSNNMFLNSTDANEACNIINSLKWNTSKDCKGIDGISRVIVKPVASCIAMPLTSIFNKPLELGKFPDKLKIAKISSIYKSDDKLQINNYWPISLLPIFFKIFEKLMYNRLLEYLNKNYALAQNQYGFREKHSTFMVLMRMVDDISNEINNKKLLSAFL